MFKKLLVFAGVFLVASQAQGKIRVATLPFQNLSSDKSVDWIGRSLAKEITLELTKYNDLSVADTLEVEKALSDVILPKGSLPVALVKNVGQRLRAEYVVFGDFQKFSAYVKVTSYIFDVNSGRVIETLKETGKVDEIFTLQDAILKKIKITLMKLAREKGTQGEKVAKRKNPQIKRKAKIDENEYTKRLLEQQLQGSTSGVSASKENQATQKLLEQEVSKMTAEDWFTKGVLLSDGSDQEIYYYKKALEVDPKYAPAHYNLGVVYYKRRQYDEAAKHFLAYLRYGDDPGKKAKIMTVLQSLQGYSKSGNAPGDRELALYWYNKGAAIGNGSDEEIRFYQWAIMADPTFAPAYYNLGSIYYERGMYREALKEFEAYLQYTNDPPDVVNDVKKIVAYLKQVVEQEPSP